MIISCDGSFDGVDMVAVQPGPVIYLWLVEGYT